MIHTERELQEWWNDRLTKHDRAELIEEILEKADEKSFVYKTAELAQITGAKLNGKRLEAMKAWWKQS